MCGCAPCTFPNKAAAASEFARVLRPAGRVGIDITIDPDQLAPELTTLGAWIACVADARPAAEYADIWPVPDCASPTSSTMTRSSAGPSTRSRPGCVSWS
jgi:hypothetical protein